MSFFDRGLLAVYSLLTIIFFVVFASALGDWWLDPLKMIMNAPQTSNYSVIFWTSIVILIIIGIRLFYVSVHWKKQDKAVVHDFTLGQVRISHLALEELVENTAYKVEGIRNVHAKVISSAGGVSIELKAMISPNLSIPETTQEVQKLIKAAVIEVTGIEVDAVKIMIEKIESNRGRVE